jgi:hypothetical protein
VFNLDNIYLHKVIKVVNGDGTNLSMLNTGYEYVGNTAECALLLFFLTYLAELKILYICANKWEANKYA